LTGRVLRNGLPGLIAVSLGIALFEFVQPILFTQFGGERELEAMVKLIPPVVQALARTQSEFLALSGLPGYLALGFTYPLYLVLAGAAVISFAANSLAGEMDRGTIQIALSQPASRSAVYISRVLGLVLICLLLALAGPAGMAAGMVYARPAGELYFANFGAVALNGMALFWAMGGLTLLGSAAASRAGRVVGWAIGLLVLSYFVDYFAGIWSALQAWTILSLFRYYDPARALVSGQINSANLIMLASVGATATVVGLIVFARRDLPA
jgi:ABC-2 type transport system permease protein